MAYTDIFTTADNGKVIACPLPKTDGGTNNFVGATASLKLLDPQDNMTTHAMTWNPTAISTIGNQTYTGRWEYALVPGDLPTGRVGLWRGMVAVTLSGGSGPIFSSEFIFSVVDPD